MTTKEEENFIELSWVCDYAIHYVGSANYQEREDIATANVEKAFEDFLRGRKPEWNEEILNTQDMPPEGLA